MKNLITEILAIWIILQLLIIGLVGGLAMNQCYRGINQGNPEAGFSVRVIAVAVPLIFFTQDYKCSTITKNKD